MALAIFTASAVTSPGDRPLGIGGHRDRALAIRVLDLRGAFAGGDGGNLLQRTIWLLPLTAIGRRSMLPASTRSSGCRRTETSRVSPLGSTQSPASTPAKATRKAWAASLAEMPRVLARPRSSQFLYLNLRILLRQAHIHGARHLAQAAHEIAGDGLQSPCVRAGEVDLHRLLGAIAQVVQHHVLGAHQAGNKCSRSVVATSMPERLRWVLLPMSTYTRPPPGLT